MESRVKFLLDNFLRTKRFWREAGGVLHKGTWVEVTGRPAPRYPS